MVKKMIVCICGFVLAFTLPTTYGFYTVDGEKIAESNVSHIHSADITESTAFFTENKGQWPEEILYLGNTDFGQVFFTQNAVYYDLIVKEEIHSASKQNPHTVKLSFEDNQTSIVQGTLPLTHYTNYFIGNNPEQWGIRCANYEKVVYANVWEKIDLVYFFSPKGLKYEFHVHPGGNYQDISVRVGGATVLSHCVSLELQTPLGSIMDDGLLVFGETSKTKYPASFVQKNDSYSFSIQCESTMEEVIVIDPTIEWSYYIGGSLSDNGCDIVLDGDYLWITGVTSSPHMHKQKNNYTDYDDVYVIKMSSNGDIEWTVYFGGNRNDESNCIAVDTSGIYVAGYSESEDLPKKRNNRIASRYYWDGYIAKITQNGTIETSVYIGGSRDDYIESIGVDKNEIYFSGTTSSIDLRHSGNTHNGGKFDTFYGKCTKDFTVSWIYYFGGTGNEWSKKILFNKTEIFVVGSTQSESLPKMINNKASTTDVFVTKIRKNGEIDKTFCYGGNSYDWGYDAILDEEVLYIAGNSGSRSLPGSFLLNSGYYDFFITELTIDFDVNWSLLLGSSRTEEPPSIAHDNDNIYITGTTNSTFFWKCENYNAGQKDIIVSSVSKDGVINWSHFVGGSNDDHSAGICLTYSDIYVLGSTYSSDLIQKRNSMNGCTKIDAFIAKINHTKPKKDEIFIEFQPDRLDFGTISVNEVSQKFTISVVNTGKVNYFGNLKRDTSWIQLKEDEFILPSGSTKSFEVWLDSTHLTPGVYQGSILLESYVKSFIIDVKVEVIQPAGFLFYPLELVYRKGKDESQFFSIGNTGQADFVGFIKTTANWIQLKENEFTLPPSSTKDFEVWVDPSNLKPGIHNETILIYSSTADLIKELRVILIIEENKNLCIIHERIDQ